ncbi:MAG: Uma2 family endonuclease [Chloroflexaceae bacterium]|nr:Uma2 family endonuclease [Chloroflexaceae bacterium]
MVATSPSPPVVAPARRRFTVDEYYRMVEAGVLRPDERLELLDGEIMQMSPIGSRHAATVSRLNALFSGATTGQYIISVQNPVCLSQHSELQPDVALLRYRADYYAAAHPTPADVLLLVEVADTTLAFDRDRKLPCYAETGTAEVWEVWIVDLERQQIEQCHTPAGAQYRSRRIWTRGETIACHAIAGLSIAVDAIFG